MKRLPFLDWTRGFAVLVMIQCHVFNSFLRVDLRQGDAYILSQFVGGIAAMLFLFLAGVTLAFQMESAERREPSRIRRVLFALTRARYILVVAVLFRVTNWLCSVPLSPWWTMLKVDILNAMALAMAALSVAAAIPGKARARFTAACGIAIAAAAPLVNFEWLPPGIAAWLQPSFKAFAFFPWAAYLAFGIAAGTVLKQTPPERMDRLQQWFVLAGFGLVVASQHASNLPYSLYSQSEFWLNSPALVLIRSGIALVLLAAAYLWTEHVASPRWSWVQTLGKTSLMAYWVHVLLVYGSSAYRWKKALSVAETTAATLIVIALMLGLAVLKVHALPAARRAWELRSSRQAAAVGSPAPQDELEPVS